MFEWFGRSIFGEINNVESIIAPGPVLSPLERIHIYKEQYFLKHQKLIRHAYPSLKEHGELLDEYIMQYPASHWCLYQYGDSLVEWLEERDQTLAELARVDRAFKRAFVAKEYPRLTSADNELLILQPFVHLFDAPHPRFTDVGPHFYVIYRSPAQEVKWKKILEKQYHLLSKFKKPSSLDEALIGFEEDLILDSFQLFTQLNWITCKV